MSDPEERTGMDADTKAKLAWGTVVGLLAIMMLLFMGTSDAAGKFVRIIAWMIPAGFLVFAAIVWLMTPRPAKPKR